MTLDCGCTPMAYDGGSHTLVHGFGCTRHPEGTALTGAEVAARRAHPAQGKRRPPVAVEDDPLVARLMHDHRYPRGCPDMACDWCGGEN